MDTPRGIQNHAQQQHHHPRTSIALALNIFNKLRHEGWRCVEDVLSTSCQALSCGSGARQEGRLRATATESYRGARDE